MFNCQRIVFSSKTVDSMKNIGVSLDSTIKSQWDRANEENMFRFKLSSETPLPSKRIPGKFGFYAELNPLRASKRRQPFHYNDIDAEFDSSNFNFKCISSKEVLLSLHDEDGSSKEEEEDYIIINNGPINLNHSMYVPQLRKGHNQVITSYSLLGALRLMHLIEDKGVLIGFNSLLAFASINHLHWHIFFCPVEIYAQTMTLQDFAPRVYVNHELIPHFVVACSEFTDLKACSEFIFAIIKCLQILKIPHSVLAVKTTSGAIHVIITPKTAYCGSKANAAFNVAVIEVCGYLPVINSERFESITEDFVVGHISPYKLDDATFATLSERIKAVAESFTL